MDEDKNKIEILRQGPVSEESLAEIAPTEKRPLAQKSWLPVKPQVITPRKNAFICLGRRRLDRTHATMR